MMKRVLLTFLLVVSFLCGGVAQTCRDKNNMTIGKINLMVLYAIHRI